MPHPPPVTPSPHRFLPGQRKARSPEKDTQAGLSLRKPAASTRASEKHTQEQATARGHFNPTPRFSFGKPKAAGSASRSPSPNKPALTEVLRVHGRLGEDVEDATEQDDDDEMLLDDDHLCALPTTEINKDGYGDGSNQWMNDIVSSSKRRKLDDRNESPGLSVFKHPQTPASLISNSTSRVAPSQAQSTISTQQLNHSRPAFLRSSVAPQESSEPPPEAFSPHKRGQKFVPGGMAATLQQWVIETGQAAVQSRKGQGYLKGEDYVMRVKIDQVAGHGPYTAYGQTTTCENTRVLLVGANKADTPLKAGGVVGIRAPLLEIEVEGERWNVGVDWRMISQQT